MRYKLLIAVSLLGALLIAQPLYAVTKSGDINIHATVPTPPPKTAPTIDHPKNDDIFEHKNITVSGRCSAGLIVKIFNNGIFAGSAICLQNGTYSLRIDLFLERNDLIARQYDSLNQPSPDSAMVSVYYIPSSQKPALPGTPSPPTVAHFQLVIDYDYTIQGIFAQQSFRLPINFKGGTPPYIVTVDWGDGSSNTFHRANTNQFDTNYSYAKPGTYIVKLGVSDSAGQKAYLQFVLLVHGETKPVTGMHLFGQKVSEDIALLVILAAIALAILAFTAGSYAAKKGKKKKPTPKSR